MVFQNLWMRVSPVAWLFPIAVMAIGALFPSLRDAIGAKIPPVSIALGLLLQVLLLVGWLIAENQFAASRETKINELQADAFRSILLSLVLSFVAGWLLAKGICPWFYVVPAISAIVDAFLTANQGLNNAAQKPIIAHDVLQRQ